MLCLWSCSGQGFQGHEVVEVVGAHALWREGVGLAEDDGDGLLRRAAARDGDLRLPETEVEWKGFITLSLDTWISGLYYAST